MKYLNIRLCANPECFKWISGNAKLCCNTKCKNRKNYIFEKMEYWYEYTNTAARKKNYKILEYLLGINRIYITREALELMGFTFDVCFAPYQNENGEYFFRFGNTYLKYNDENNYEIKYIDYDEAQQN